VDFISQPGGASTTHNIKDAPFKTSFKNILKDVPFKTLFKYNRGSQTGFLGH